MDILPTIAETRSRLKKEALVAFVPTMGNLHQGHLDLVRIARERAACVAVSIFVNRLQFGPNEDFDRYPRTFAADCAQLERLGVDVVFAPDEKELYPEMQQFLVAPPPVADILEGEYRSGFFRGVVTVVLKLFNIVRPHIAVFGKKDYQQLHIVRGLVRQLALPIEIVAGETLRAPDGLALSSRNQYLSPAERAEAVRLYQALTGVKVAVMAGDADFRGLAEGARKLLDKHGWNVDYVALHKQATLDPAQPGDLDLVVLGAARLGSTRLIDNMEIRAPGR
ncbi:MAG: pantoate--beta-alanine ligase [Betaproteobacteria bacterium]|nr:pantoate--beta-alanine ligase [Betaproteobacteria bacterium]